MAAIVKKIIPRELNLFGLNRFAIYLYNPFNEWFRFEKVGPLLYVFLPGIKITCLVGKVGNEQT